MSVIIDATYEGETFEVEVFHDGSIEFPGRDLQYEQAEAEFRPPGSAIVQLFNKWMELPVEVIVDVLWVMEGDCNRLISEYVYHALDSMEHHHKKRNHSIVNKRAMMRTIRLIWSCVKSDYIEDGVPNIGRIRYGVNKIRYEASFNSFIGKYAMKDVSIRKIVSSSHSLSNMRAGLSEESSWRRRRHFGIRSIADSATTCADYAAQAVGYAASGDPDEDEIDENQEPSSEYLEAYQAEGAWQIRRFVDVMEAIGQGKDWPVLGVTT